MLLKRRMAEEVPTYVTTQKQAALLYAAWNGSKELRRKRGEGEEQYKTEAKQMEEIERELQRDDSKAFCFL